MKKIIISIIILFISITVYANPTYSYRYINNSTKNVKLVIKYPKIKGKGDLVKLANKGIYEYLYPVIDIHKDFFKYNKNKKGYYDVCYSTVTRCDDKIISIFFIGDIYAGGAHNLPIVDGLTFGIVNGKAKKLTIHDVYDPYKAANDIYYVWLHEKREYVGYNTKKDILYEEPSIKMLNNFTISKNKITFYRKVYSFAPFCCDWDYVKLPFNKF